MGWQFLLQRQDAPPSYCWLQGTQPLRPGVYRLWGRTADGQGKTATVEWLWPTGSGRQRYRQREVATHGQGLALLMPWTFWPAGTWHVRCRGEQASPTWESWSDGLMLRVTPTPEPPQIAALYWQYRCRFPWHQTLRVKGWVTGGQELSLHIHDPLRTALVLHIQQPLTGNGTESEPKPVPFCCDVAIPQYLYQRVLLAVIQVLGTPLRQELLLVNPQVTAQLTPELTVSSCSLEDLAHQAQTIISQRELVLPPRLTTPGLGLR